MKPRLTPTQENALLHLYEKPLTEVGVQVLVSRQRRTMTSLEGKELARWFPYGADGQGCWKITNKGKQYVEKYLTEDA